MDLALKPEHKAFADEVRDFARKNLSPATREKTFNGKHYDNRLKNLRFLCPNCHSQTDTYSNHRRPNTSR